ncbi:hypothetical protein DNH61_25370 [Paenibacillus sambharensis]|uniref:Glycosyltransferase 2-like domain-containing protein n=1 Tax=Paenibacillus sambharensis TaxID=1803190 RepID=A0A2W1L4J9_9BACL|nr:TPR domain-containing glycosyltransferase [Paenibacillus sambharensis]PZD93110.1 hypothetical protein DNH61_25370 [Paenibacillus sambharensis]
MEKPLISLCMIVRNEEQLLPRCLRSVQGAADEMIVVDTGSSDRTVEIAREFGAQVIAARWENDFAAARNIGLEQASGRWILQLDADEELERGQHNELRQWAARSEFDGLLLQVHNHAGSDPGSSVVTINPIVRMFRNYPACRYKGSIHEQIAASILETKPGAAFHCTPIRIHHYGYAAEWVKKKDKVTRNRTLLQEALRRAPDDSFHHYNLAVEYMRVHDYESALRHLRQSRRFLPGEVSYKHLLYKYEAYCLSSLARADEAVKVLDQGRELYPDYTDLHHTKAVVLIRQGNKKQAAILLRRAVRLGPAPLAYHTEAGIGTYQSCFLLGQLVEEQGSPAEAADYYLQAVTHNPSMTSAWQRLFRLMRLEGREQAIARLIFPVLDRLPDGNQPNQARLIRHVLLLLAEESCLDTARALKEQYMGSSAGPAVRLNPDFEAQLASACAAEQPDDPLVPELPEEWSTAVRAASLSGDNKLAWKLLSGWIEQSKKPDASTKANPSDHAYRLSLTLIALADIQLAKHGGPESPKRSVIRQARAILPYARLRREDEL